MQARHEQIKLFKTFERPTLAVTANLTGADPRPSAEEAGLPTAAILLWALAASTLDIPEFRLRMASGGVYEIDGLSVSFTVLGPDEQLRFAFAKFDFDVIRFATVYQEAAARAAAGPLRSDGPPELDLIYTSIAPWMAFSHVEQPYASKDAASIPSFAIGRLEHAGDDCVCFPLAAQVHHGLVDGLHLARLFKAVPEKMSVAIGALRPAGRG